MGGTSQIENRQSAIENQTQAGTLHPRMNVAFSSFGTLMLEFRPAEFGDWTDGL
jgi:hypothetical protein